MTVTNFMPRSLVAPVRVSGPSTDKSGGRCLVRGRPSEPSKDAHLAGRQWIAGDNLTLADLAIASP